MKLEASGRTQSAAALAQHEGPETPLPPMPRRYEHHVEMATPDAAQLIWRLVHYRRVIAQFLIGGLALGLLWSWLQTPQYRAETTIEILTAPSKALEDIDAIATHTDANAVETARARFTSRDLAQRVAESLALADDPHFLNGSRLAGFATMLSAAPEWVRRANAGSVGSSDREREAITQVMERLEVSPVRNTNILKLNFVHPDAVLTARILNQATSSFIDQAAEQRVGISQAARGFIEQQVIQANERLESSERALVDYAAGQGITLNAHGPSVLGANITEINERLTNARQARLALERQVRQVDAGHAASLPQVLQSETIETAKQRIAELRGLYQEKRATLKPGFPEMRRLQGQIAELERQMSREVAAIAGSLRLQLEQADGEIAALVAELADLDAQQSAFQRKNIGYSILQREVDSDRAQYESLNERLNDIIVGANLRTANAAVIDPAVVPDEPFSPSYVRNLGISLALASLAVAGVIQFRQRLDSTFSSPDQIEAELGVPVLGVVPKSTAHTLSDAMADPGSDISEAHRSLRTALQFTGGFDDMRTLLVTSTEPGEGKTSTAFKLAVEFSALNKHVLVIDGDLRRPALHRVFRTDNGVGLSNVLSNFVEDDIQTPVFRKTPRHNVDFIASGTLPPSPADLLATERMAALLQFCASRYDLVIVDAPPVAGLADALILSRLADATLFVVGAGHTKRQAAAEAIGRLRGVGANLAGVVFTKFDAQGSAYRYGHAPAPSHAVGLAGERG